MKLIFAVLAVTLVYTMVDHGEANGYSWGPDANSTNSNLEKEDDGHHDEHMKVVHPVSPESPEPTKEIQEDPVVKENENEDQAENVIQDETPQSGSARPEISGVMLAVFFSVIIKNISL